MKGDCVLMTLDSEMRLLAGKSRPSRGFLQGSYHSIIMVINRILDSNIFGGKPVGYRNCSFEDVTTRSNLMTLKACSHNLWRNHNP